MAEVYSWTWRHLPGPLPLRLLQTVILLAAAVALLLFVVFPRADTLLPYNDVTVDRAPGASQNATPLPTP